MDIYQEFERVQYMSIRQLSLRMLRRDLKNCMTNMVRIMFQELYVFIGED